ncbi:DUF4013 domain-containing protein [Adlercreutzia sp. ZJ304]|uniref:DUF4013 domain-containing protein n=1 Tax=Adlercreutzia sp. ZJ304 TaxID=2709791 RepID=UPI0013EB8C9D|nr:DUF4013 domain-containing protein [Adlercreutzia sp. ZJ304]
MFCPKCGKENPDGNAVCYSCSAELPKPANAEAQTPQQPAAQAASQAQPAAAQPQSQPQPAAAQQPTAQPQPQPTAQATYQQPAAQVYKKGCISSAWDDIKHSEGWFGHTLLLGLINIVPILNWIVPGYCMRWARQLPMGKIAPMPKGIFVNRGFVNGAFWFLLSLVFGLVGSIVAGILSIVPLLGWIAGIAIAFFVEMFLDAALMRTALADRLGAGFDFSAIWTAFKRSPGSLLCISIVPALIIAACVCVITVVIIGIAALFVGGDIMSLAMTSYYSDAYSYSGYYSPESYYTPEIIAAALAIIGTLIPAILICYIIGCFATAFQYLLTFRALGHWTARYASDWITDPTVSASANTHPDQV